MDGTAIEQLLNSGAQATLAVTGGGSGAVHALLSTPGASRLVRDVRIPYSPSALSQFLGGAVAHSCAPDTALRMARVAFDPPALALSCTAALRTDRARRGADRAFICVKGARSERLYALHFSPASRARQEQLLSDWLLVLLAQAVGAARALVLPGSFNPVHRGHWGMLRAAERMTGARGVFELSAANVDKPPISEQEMLRRARVIHDVPVALTRAARFTQKAQLFPESTFVLGFDTAARLVAHAPKEEWNLFGASDVCFLVAGRKAEQFQTLYDLELPEEAAPLLKPIPEKMFREDISSTQLRGEQ